MSTRVLARRDPDGQYDRLQFYERIGLRLIDVRERRGISKNELARRVGGNTSSITNAEQGQTCSLHLFVRIAEELDVDLNDLVPLDATD